MTAKWTRERIVREILARDAQGLGVNHIGGEHGVAPRMYQAACRIFGSWTNAVTAAGLPPNRARAKQDWSPARIVAVIRRLARRRVPLSARDVQERYGQLVPAARRCFGSWSKAIYAARVDPQRLQRSKSWTRERVIESILLKEIRNEPLQRTRVEPRMLTTAGARLFGSWQAALDAAKTGNNTIAGAETRLRSKDLEELHNAPDSHLSRIQHRRGKSWSDLEIIVAVIQRRRSGAAMNAQLVHQQQAALYRAALRRFGSWKNVMVAAGLPVAIHSKAPVSFPDGRPTRHR